MSEDAKRTRLDWILSLQTQFAPVVNLRTGICVGCHSSFQPQDTTPISSQNLSGEADGFQLMLLMLEKVIGKFRQPAWTKEYKLFFQVDETLLLNEDNPLSRLVEKLTIYNMVKDRLVFCLNYASIEPPTPKMVEKLKLFRSKGFKLATWVSRQRFLGFDLLYTLEPDFLLYDGDLINGISEDPKLKIMVHNLLNTGHLLGCLNVACEVKRHKDLKTCRELGFDLMQGDVVQPPVTNLAHLQEKYPAVLDHSPADQQNLSEYRKFLEKQLDYIEALYHDQDVLVVFEKFRRNKTNTFFPVLNKDDEPMGVIREVDLKEYVYSQYGRELLRNRSFSAAIQAFISHMPFVDISTPAEQMLEIFSINDSMEGVMVTDNLKYKGFLSAHAFLKILSHTGATEASSGSQLGGGDSNLVQEYIHKALELKTAAAIQQTLLPRTTPMYKELELASFFQSATETGGDWYGFMTQFDDRLYILIGDVTGHGTPSALVTASACATCRTIENLFATNNQPPSPAQLMAQLNNVVHASGAPRYLMTFFAAQIDLTQGLLTFCNAGHNFPFLIKTDGTYSRLLNRNPVLGHREEVKFNQAQLQLEQGDLLFFFTDGLVENLNPQDEMWGERKLGRYLTKYRKLPPKQLVDALVTDLFNFYDGRHLEDDVTMVACHILNKYPKSTSLRLPSNYKSLPPTSLMPDTQGTNRVNKEMLYCNAV